MIKSFIRALWKKRIMVLFILLLSFTLGAFSSEIYNHFFAKYDLVFQSDIVLKSEDITLDLLESVQEQNEKFKEIDIDKILLNNDIYIERTDNYHLISKCRYYATFFSSKSSSVKTRAEAFLKGVALKLDNNAKLVDNEALITQNHINYPICGLIMTGIGLLSYSIYVFIKKDDINNEANNKEDHLNPFSLAYYKDSLNSFKSVKSISAIAILFALMIVCKFLSIPTGFANLKISFVYLFFVLIAMLYGPIPGLIIGMMSDILGFVLIPSGAFYFGYTIQAALTGLVYGLCFYKNKVTFMHCFFARLLVNIFLNVILGSFLWGHIMNYELNVTLSYMIAYELPKNIIFLLPQSILLHLFLKTISPALIRLKYLDVKYDNCQNKKASLDA